MLEVSKSGYYAWKRRPKSRRRIDNEGLLIEIRRVFVDNDSNYGSPRIHKEFKKAAIPCSKNRVVRLMREAGLVAALWRYRGENSKPRRTRIIIGRRNPQAGLIHHSDRGSQYASGDYQALLKGRGITPSMSRKGDCWDNAVAESFIHTLKVEKVHRYRFKTRDEAKSKIFEYVEMYYNWKRTHSSLGYLSPLDYEKRSFPSLLTVH